MFNVFSIIVRVYLKAKL